jgi:hypothetical protein
VYIVAKDRCAFSVLDISPDHVAYHLARRWKMHCYTVACCGLP